MRAVLNTFVATLFIGVVMLSSAMAARGESSIVARPHLYEVRKDGQVSWLFGSLHRGIEYSDVEPFVAGPLRRARHIIFERVNQPRTPERDRLWKTDPAQAILTSKSYNFKSGNPLSDSDRQFLMTYGVPKKLALAVRTDSCAALNMFFDHLQPSIDDRIEDDARSRGVKMSELDSEALLAAVDALAFTVEPPCNAMQTASDRVNPGTAMQNQQIFDQYREGAAMYPVTTTEIILRNKAWMRKLVIEFARGETFAVVGVGHLYGEPYGLLQLLRDAGFDVRRVP